MDRSVAERRSSSRQSEPTCPNRRSTPATLTEDARPIPGTIFTTLDGVIEWVDTAGSDLLHVSTAACPGRELIRFFGANRVDVLRAIEDACAGDVVQGTGLIRPRERAPRSVTFTVQFDPDQAGSLKWIFERSEEP